MKKIAFLFSLVVLFTGCASKTASSVDTNIANPQPIAHQDFKGEVGAKK